MSVRGEPVGAVALAPAGYHWSDRARFYAPGRSVTIAATECFACGWAKGRHGPMGQCPESDDEAVAL